MEGVIRTLAQKKTQWNEDIYFAVKFAQQKLSKCYTAVTPITGMPFMTAHIFDPVWKLQLFWKWDKGMDIDPEPKASYTTQHQKAILKYVENEHYVKHRCLPVTKPESLWKNIQVSSAMA
jgi:hypothetical protein